MGLNDSKFGGRGNAAFGGVYMDKKAEEVVAKLNCPKCGRRDFRLHKSVVICRNCRFTAPVPIKRIKNGDKQKINQRKNGKKAGQSQSDWEKAIDTDQGPAGDPESEGPDVQGSK